MRAPVVVNARFARSWRWHGFRFWLAAALAVAVSSCVKSALLNGQIQATREAAPAIDTLGDYEVARSIAYAGLGQFEGMHRLAPENEDALFLLARGWTATSFAFIEDDYEAAADGEDETQTERERMRARAAYARAVEYGVALLDRRVSGFAQAKKNLATMQRHLAHFDKSDALNLLWVGQAWLGRANVAKDDAPTIAELYVGEALIERSIEFDETLEGAAGHAALGAYHARTAMAELEESLRHFSRAIELTKGKALLPKVMLAHAYYCMKGDKAAYEKTLREVVDAPDLLPDQRLRNAIAKRRARRYLTAARMASCGF
jgi:hypothetical protein